jgi:hypothetical protein
MSLHAPALAPHLLKLCAAAAEHAQGVPSSEACRAML